MNKYNTFLTLFIVSVIALIVFMIFYVQTIMGFALHSHEYMRNEDPGEFLSQIFSPQILISLVVAGLTGLAYRIQGIVLVVRNKTVSDGEKALWIVGFIIMGFVTAIVFLIMARGRKFVE